MQLVGVGPFRLWQQWGLGVRHAPTPCFAGACRSFGVPTVPAKQLIKDLPKLFESKDVKARDKVKEIMVSTPHA